TRADDAAAEQLAPPLRIGRDERVAAAGLDPLRLAPLRVGSGERPDAVLAGRRAGRRVGLDVAVRDDRAAPDRLAGVVHRGHVVAESRIAVRARTPAPSPRRARRRRQTTR